MNHKYHLNLFYSKEDGGFIADVPDLRYCSAYGHTPEEALREVQVAIKLWVQTARKHKQKAPPARYRPAIYGAA